MAILLPAKARGLKLLLVFLVAFLFTFVVVSVFISKKNFSGVLNSLNVFSKMEILETAEVSESMDAAETPFESLSSLDSGFLEPSRQGIAFDETPYVAVYKDEETSKTNISFIGRVSKVEGSIIWVDVEGVSYEVSLSESTNMVESDAFDKPTQPIYYYVVESDLDILSFLREGSLVTVVGTPVEGTVSKVVATELLFMRQ